MRERRQGSGAWRRDGGARRRLAGFSPETHKHGFPCTKLDGEGTKTKRSAREIHRATCTSGLDGGEGTTAATAYGAWPASVRGMERHRAHGLKRGVAFLTLLRTSGRAFRRWRGDEEGDRGGGGGGLRDQAELDALSGRKTGSGARGFRGWYARRARTKRARGRCPPALRGLQAPVMARRPDPPHGGACTGGKRKVQGMSGCGKGRAGDRFRVK
jgi:hypothetical protein